MELFQGHSNMRYFRRRIDAMKACNFGINALVIIILTMQASTATGKNEAENTINPGKNSLCMANEKIYFSCQLPQQTIVSICEIYARVTAQRPEAYPTIQYRIGTIRKLALAYPAEPNSKKETFFGEHLRPHNENIQVDSIMFLLKGKLHGISIRDGDNSFVGIWTAGSPYAETQCIGKPEIGNFLELVLSLPPMK